MQSSDASGGMVMKKIEYNRIAKSHCQKYDKNAKVEYMNFNSPPYSVTYRCE